MTSGWGKREEVSWFHMSYEMTNLEMLNVSLQRCVGKGFGVEFLVTEQKTLTLESCIF